MKQWAYRFKSIYFSRSHTFFTPILVLFIVATFTGYIIALNPPAVSMLIVVMVTLVAVFWAKTGLGLICIVLARPIFDALWSSQILSVSFLNLSLLQIFGGLVTASIFAYLFLRHKNIVKTPILKSILIFLGIYTLSALFFAPSLLFEITIWFKLVSSFAIGLLVVEIFDNYEKIKKLLSVLLFVCVVIIVISLSDFFMGGHAYYPGLKHSIFGVYAGPHSLCYSLLMIQPIILFKISMEDKAWRRLIYWLLVGVIGFVIFNSLVRNGWIGFSVQIILYSVFKRNWKLLTAFLLLTGIIMFTNYELITKRFSDVVIPTSKASLSDWVMAGRIGLWRANISYFVDSSPLAKLVGGGFYRSLDASEKYLSKLSPPHSDYLFLLLGTGIIGLVAFLSILVQLYKALISLIKAKGNPLLHNIGVSGFVLLISYLVIVSNVNLIAAPNSQWYFWCLGGIVISLARIYRKEGVKNKQ